MANSVLTNDLIAKEALFTLENELVLSKLVYRGYQSEYSNRTNGYKPGETISIRKPARYTLREGATMSTQDSVEGKTSITVSTQIGVDIGGWSSADMTMKISDFRERFLVEGMRTIAQGIDAKVAALYKDVWNWVGTPGQTVNSFSDFAAAPQRMDEMAVPATSRSAALSAADYWGLVGNFTGLYINDTAKSALQRAKLPMIGNVDPYMTQNVASHTVGLKAGTPLVKGAVTASAYADVKDTNTQSITTDGWTVSQNAVKAGDVVTFAGCYAVNPRSKDVQSYLQQFVVTADAAADSSGNATLVVSPAIITSGAYQTVSAAPADNAAITVMGTAGTSYSQNMVFHKNAFAMAIVPLEVPMGAVNVSRSSYNGFSIRMIPVYTGSNDTSAVRMDVLMGVKTIYPDLATRLSGAA